MSQAHLAIVAESPFEAQFLTANAGLKLILERAYRLALSMVPLLLLGDTGVGKSLLVKDLHFLSRRRGTLQTIECPALAEHLIESEMFGHVRGAFTGSVKDREGLIQAANEGTAFLDELGDLPLPLQAKLLRAVQDGQIRRVGATEDISVDIRWISATNVDLAARVRTGEFRSDLYHRLGQGIIRIPPLRERPEDVLLLVRHFFQGESLKQEDVLSGEALSALCSYNWPGNVRELQSVLRIALVTRGDGIIEPSHLQFQPGLLTESTSENDPGIRVGQSVKQARRLLVEATLRKLNGNRQAAAAMLNVGLQTLKKWLGQWQQP